jgi:hypothetical protein
MAKILIGSELGKYVFNHTTQTIKFSGFTATIERLLLITDVTNNTIIYQFNDPLRGGVIVNNVLTLDYNTNVVGFASTDILQIFYWSENPQDVTDDTNRLIIQTQASNQIIPDTAGRARVILEGTNNINIVSTVSTVTTVTGLTNIGGLNAITHIPSMMQIPIEVQMQKIVIS